jgi:hypothetical protein
MILTFLILGFVGFLTYASYCNAIMDLISPKDLLAHRGFKWSKEAMEAGKDRNKDGKISFFENTWPDDEWHKHKREMFIALGVVCCFGLAIGAQIAVTQISLLLKAFLCISCMPVVFFSMSYFFELFYTHIKK